MQVVDGASHLEVDELTRTVSVVFEPLEWGYLLNEPYPLLPFLTLRCYN